MEWNVKVYENDELKADRSFDSLEGAVSWKRSLRAKMLEEWLYQFDEISPSPSPEAYMEMLERVSIRFKVSRVPEGVNSFYYHQMRQVVLPRLALEAFVFPTEGRNEKKSILAKLREWIGLD